MVGDDSMAKIALHASSGDAQVDEALAGIIGIYETAFTDRVRGYYLLGSYTDSSAVDFSDIDLLVLFKSRMEAAEAEAAERLAHACNRLSLVRLDLWHQSEAGLADSGKDPGSLAVVALKLGSALVYGADVRDQLSLPPLPEYTRAVMMGGQFFLRHVLRSAERLVCPLAYPDPDGEFFGYDTVRITEWYPPGTAHGIKELVTSASRVATALLALRAGRYVGRKSASITAYRVHIGDEWAEYLEAIYTNGKARWRYHVPEAADERRQLRALCARTLGFENHFLSLYRDYLVEMLGSNDERSRRLAAERLAEVDYPDDEIIAALQQAREAGDDRVRRAAGAALDATCGDRGGIM
jgi:hypothetical protein